MPGNNQLGKSQILAFPELHRLWQHFVARQGLDSALIDESGSQATSDTILTGRLLSAHCVVCTALMASAAVHRTSFGA